MKLRLGLFLLAALLSPAVALAQGGTSPQVGVTNWTTQVNGLGTGSSRATACIDVKNQAYLMVRHVVDRDGTPLVSAAVTSCLAYETSACDDAIGVQLGSCSGNTCTQFAPSWAIDADEGWSYRFDVAGHDYALCTVSFTAGDAGDTITVKTRKLRR